MTPDWPAIAVREVRFGDSVELQQFPTGGFVLLHGQGRGQRLAVGEGAISAVLALASPVSFVLGSLQWPLRSRWMQVWRGPAMELGALDAGHWFALCGPVDAWDRLCRLAGDHRHRDATLFTHRSPAPRPVARAMIRLARADARNAGTQQMLLRCLASGLLKNQGGLSSKLNAVNGRNLVARHATMASLACTRDLIDATGCQELDEVGSVLPQAASGPAFNRHYRRVFGETIPQHLMRARAQTAYDLVCHSNMAMQEISAEVGFTSASSFTRFFAGAYGMSPRQARCLARAGRLSVDHGKGDCETPANRLQATPSTTPLPATTPIRAFPAPRGGLRRGG